MFTRVGDDWIHFSGFRRLFSLIFNFPSVSFLPETSSIVLPKLGSILGSHSFSLSSSSVFSHSIFSVPRYGPLTVVLYCWPETKPLLEGCPLLVANHPPHLKVQRDLGSHRHEKLFSFCFVFSLFSFCLITLQVLPSFYIGITGGSTSLFPFPIKVFRLSTSMNTI